VKKEVAERWKRVAKGAETNAEGVRIEAPRGRGMGRGVPLPNRLGGLGERRELPQRGPKTNLDHFVAAKTLIATIYLICFIKHCSCSFSLLF